MKTRLRLRDGVKFSLVAIVGLVLCIVSLNKTNEEFIKDCTSVGYSQNYCERKG